MFFISPTRIPWNSFILSQKSKNVTDTTFYSINFSAQITFTQMPFYPDTSFDRILINEMLVLPSNTASSLSYSSSFRKQVLFHLTATQMDQSKHVKQESDLWLMRLPSSENSANRGNSICRNGLFFPILWMWNGRSVAYPQKEKSRVNVLSEAKNFVQEKQRSWKCWGIDRLMTVNLAQKMHINEHTFINISFYACREMEGEVLSSF